MINGTNTALPISWTSSSHWDGNDGLWNTFIVSAGTPPQSFRILPSTAGQETWLPDPSGCDAANPTDPGSCGYLRGSLPVAGVNSSGFNGNQSDTWVANGLFDLNAPEINLGYNPAGRYGFDIVALGDGGEGNDLNLTYQVIAGVGALDFWTGFFGLGPRAGNFTTFDDPVPCFMRNLVTNEKIPSLSWGYTAGAHYRDNASASLTLGGYDGARFVPTNLSIAMNEDNSRPLQASVEGIKAENSICGSTTDMLLDPTFHLIDSTVPHIWLPDDQTDLYLVNDTVRSRLLDLSPTITFAFSNGSAGEPGAIYSIELPYAAFDLQASYPFYQEPTNYFPIRRAANATQYTIGRTLLQEAYLIADFERSNFTIAQVSFENTNTQTLVAITKPDSGVMNSASPSTSRAILSGGVIAGIVVGTIALIAATAGTTCLFFGRRRRTARQGMQKISAVHGPTFELAHDDHQRWELPSDHALVEMPSSLKSKEVELRAVEIGQEMDGTARRHDMPLIR